jgi:membrane-associated phospholipid phosphatase
MVGLSRPYLRVHWPSEVSAGLVIAALARLPETVFYISKGGIKGIGDRIWQWM